MSAAPLLPGDVAPPPFWAVGDRSLIFAYRAGNEAGAAAVLLTYPKIGHTVRAGAAGLVLARAENVRDLHASIALETEVAGRKFTGIGGVLDRDGRALAWEAYDHGVIAAVRAAVDVFPRAFYLRPWALAEPKAEGA